MAEFLINFSPNRSDSEPTPNEQIMGQKKNQEVLAALLAFADEPTGKEKEKRKAWKAALAVAEAAYFTDFDFALQAVFAYATEAEKKDAFKGAFTKLHETVIRDRATWTTRADDIPGFIVDDGKAYLKSMCQLAKDAPEDSNIVRELQNGQEAGFRRVYAGYRDYFVAYAKTKFQKADLETVTDVYQDAWIVLLKYVNDQKIRIVQDGKGEELLVGLRNKASIKTLLTAIGSNMLKKEMADSLVITTSEPDINLPDIIGEGGNFSESDHALLMKALESLGEKCQFLLGCRYWFKLSYREIQAWTDATSEEALRTQQNRCMKYLIRTFKKLKGDF